MVRVLVEVGALAWALMALVVSVRRLVNGLQRRPINVIDGHEFPHPSDSGWRVSRFGLIENGDVRVLSGTVYVSDVCVARDSQAARYAAAVERVQRELALAEIPQAL